MRLKTLFWLIVIVHLLRPSNVPAAVGCPTGARLPVVSWLTQRIDSVTIEHLWWRPETRPPAKYGYSTTTHDPRFIQGLLSLTGAPVPWLDYSHKEPFGGFTYPDGGQWFEEYTLHVGKTDYQVWVWYEWDYTARNVLVFTFADMIQSTDNQGQHKGEHDFCAVSVSKSDLNKIDPDIYLTWKQ